MCFVYNIREEEAEGGKETGRRKRGDIRANLSCEFWVLGSNVNIRPKPKAQITYTLNLGLKLDPNPKLKNL